MSLSPKQFQRRLFDFYQHQGRKDLPWQKSINAYRVWVSEIMLQQTQVSTVIPYYKRFMKRFPTLKKLGLAEADEVLHYWSGLGYYARARNLHRSAQIIHQDYHGRFPTQFQQIIALPGIGRSTAGAILSIAAQIPTPILDGNVKRVLTRFHAIEGWPDEPSIKQTLWDLAEKYTPQKNVDIYTQAIMDLGAMVCTRTKPTCSACPLQTHCAAYQQQRVEDLPYKKRRKALPIRSIVLLLLLNDAGNVLLEKRPSNGIWGGLWGLIECEKELNISQWCQKTRGLIITDLKTHPSFRHTFTHFHLDITPVSAKVTQQQKEALETTRTVWYNVNHPQKLGLAAPVKLLLKAINPRSTLQESV